MGAEVLPFNLTSLLGFSSAVPVSSKRAVSNRLFIGRVRDNCNNYYGYLFAGSLRSWREHVAHSERQRAMGHSRGRCEPAKRETASTPRISIARFTGLISDYPPPRLAAALRGLYAYALFKG